MNMPASDGPDDWFFQPEQQKWLRHSGVSRWRRVLAEHRREAATPEARAARQAFLDRYGIPADSEVRGCGVTLVPMEQETGEKLTVDEVDARMGWTITDEGKSRARAALDRAADVDWDALRARFGITPTTA